MDADVVVIGAGAAGLAAARRLASKSVSVIVLEARDRIGGRVWPVALEGGALAELGAEFIHGKAPETMALLREAGIETAALDGEGWTCRNGELVPDGTDFVAAARILNDAADLSEDETVDMFLKRYEGDSDMRDNVRAARAFVEGFDAADPSIASAQAIAEEWGSGVDFASSRPIGGYAPLLQLLRSACEDAGAKIILETKVQKIAWEPSALTVEALDAGGHVREFSGRAALVTLPIGVLRDRSTESIAFQPGLPDWKLHAFAGIAMGQVVKVDLRFRTRFWENIGDGRYSNAVFFRCSGSEFGVFWTQFPVRNAVITAWVGGPKAVGLSEFSADELTDRAVRDLGALFADATLVRREFAGGIMHDWAHDPLTRGAYSYVVAGGGDARSKLAMPIENALFFAGEATSLNGQGGTVNGALETGERAAREIARAVGAEVING